METARIDLIDTSGRGMPEADQRLILRLIAASARRAVIERAQAMLDAQLYPCVAIRLAGVDADEVLHLAERLRANLDLAEVGVELAGQYHLLTEAGAEPQG